MKVQITLDEGVEIPIYKTEESAGFDLKAKTFLKLFKGKKEMPLNEVMQFAQEKGYINLRPHERVLIGTGIRIALPVGTEMQIRPRSGVALKRGLTVVNSPGTIDSDYRGEICVIIFNTTGGVARIDLGEDIAQAVIAPFIKAELVPVQKLNETARGEGGFGSTDVKKKGLLGNVFNR